MFFFTKLFVQHLCEIITHSRLISAASIIFVDIC